MLMVVAAGALGAGKGCLGTGDDPVRGRTLITERRGAIDAAADARPRAMTVGAPFKAANIFAPATATEFVGAMGQQDPEAIVTQATDRIADAQASSTRRPTSTSTMSAATAVGLVDRGHIGRRPESDPKRPGQDWASPSRPRDRPPSATAGA